MALQFGVDKAVSDNYTNDTLSPPDPYQPMIPRLLWLVKQPKYIDIYRASRIASIVLLTVISASSIVHLGCLACLLFRKRLRTPFNRLIIGITCSDLMITGISAPFRLYRVIWERSLHVALCVLGVGFSTMSVTSSIVLVGIIAALRAKVVCYPTASPLTLNQAAILQVIAFLVGLAAAAIQTEPATASMLFCTGTFLSSAKRKRVGWILIMVVYGAGYFIIIASYLAICIGVRRSKRRVADAQDGVAKTRSEKPILNGKCVILIISAYTICYLPSFLVAVISNTTDIDPMIGFAVFDVLTSVFYLHAATTPLLYLVGSTIFRREFFAFIRSSLPWTRQTTTATGTDVRVNYSTR